MISDRPEDEDEDGMLVFLLKYFKASRRKQLTVSL